MHQIHYPDDTCYNLNLRRLFLHYGSLGRLESGSSTQVRGSYSRLQIVGVACTGVSERGKIL